ncbi:sulfurtransferase [Leptolyngbya boryana CZ1]|uniref:Sulfurtransferase n=1 Tax=Leptolyngbya boryana CZ1 TaxID=3060204 RepID=A0AA96WZS1_LEPBY|nr:sulfurtransferase [Leptolyngbya boryana]WNZ48261.1 sulfurtransferase [Leptolyngbya boryana CZ1]
MYAHPEVLVDTQWLQEHLTDPNLRILEVDMSPDLYKDAHLPGAVFWSIFDDLLLPNLGQNLDAIAFQWLLSRSGITPETIVVAYGSYPGTGAWIFWLFKLFGHDNIRVLNGGYQKWKAENRPLVAELSTVSPVPEKAVALNPDLRVLKEEVQTAIDHPNTALLDVRTLEEFQGKIFLNQPPTGNERGGHIPGAIHIEHLEALNPDGTFKSFEELQKLYGEKGITRDREIFPYCAIGGRSAFVWFVLKYLLGYPRVRNYDGSWNEWSRISELPVES